MTKKENRSRKQRLIPPENVTAGKVEKLARQYADVWENKIKGYVALDENRTFRELAD